MYGAYHDSRYSFAKFATSGWGPDGDFYGLRRGRGGCGGSSREEFRRRNRHHDEDPAVASLLDAVNGSATPGYGRRKATESTAAPEAAEGAVENPRWPSNELSDALMIRRSPSAGW